MPGGWDDDVRITRTDGKDMGRAGRRADQGIAVVCPNSKTNY